VNRRLKLQPESSTQEVLAGLVERVTLHTEARGRRDAAAFHLGPPENRTA
jgi:hypothetical protein